MHENGHKIVAEAVGLAKSVAIDMAPDPGANMLAATLIELKNGMPVPRAADLDGLSTVALAGRAAEEIAYGDASGGAGGGPNSDLAIATRLAVAMEVSLGLGGQLTWHGNALNNAEVSLTPEVRVRVEARLKTALRRAKRIVRTGLR